MASISVRNDGWFWKSCHGVVPVHRVDGLLSWIAFFVGSEMVGPVVVVEALVVVELLDATAPLVWALL